VGVSVPSFLRTHDEAAFRAREYEALVDALTGDVIVATGGGVVTTAPARAALREQRTVWLDCPDDILLHRVASGDRPLLGGDAAAALLQLRSERGPWYRDVASARVDASQSVEAIVNDVVALLKDEVQ